MNSKKILVVGAKGQLGLEFLNMLKENNEEIGPIPKFYEDAVVKGLSFLDLDITKKEDVFSLIKKEKPYAVVNCAAFTNVDLCETEKEMAFKVNALGPRNLAMACEKEKAKLIHISTDYVFDGQVCEKKIESDAINPQSVYGKSKALGEQYVKNFCRSWFILRTSWLYGQFGNNFVKTIVKAAKEKGVLNVVKDQIGTPTYALDLSYLILRLIPTQEYGLFHCSGNGQCSWFEFAEKIVENFKINAKVNSCFTQDFKRAAKRPKFSVLENFMLKLTIGDFFRDWKQALKSFAKKNKKLSL